MLSLSCSHIKILSNKNNKTKFKRKERKKGNLFCSTLVVGMLSSFQPAILSTMQFCQHGFDPPDLLLWQGGLLSAWRRGCGCGSYPDFSKAFETFSWRNWLQMAWMSAIWNYIQLVPGYQWCTPGIWGSVFMCSLRTGQMTVFSVPELRNGF